LLVVIAIIAILAAILFPVFARAREKANQTACLSNIKQLALAAHMYMQDYDEHLLFACYQMGINDGSNYSWWRWYWSLEPYTKSMDLLKCESYKFNPGRSPNSYGYNAYNLGYYLRANQTSRMYVGVKLAEVPRPSEIIMFGPRYCMAGDDMQRSICYYYCTPLAHNGGDNYSFVDGHAKWMKFDTLVPSVYYNTYWSW
jgi:prepilin-type processing-associated H-X9-DG protein